MINIQFILIPVLIALVITYFKKLRSHLFDRCIVLVLGTLGIAMVLFPDWAQWLAGLVGVGRGADLLFYLAILALVYTNILLFAKMRSLENSMTQMARDQAIHEGRSPNDA